MHNLKYIIDMLDSSNVIQDLVQLAFDIGKMSWLSNLIYYKEKMYSTEQNYHFLTMIPNMNNTLYIFVNYSCKEIKNYS